MINFSVGPVQMDEKILKLASEQIPYFRTAEFSELMKDNERLLKKFLNAEDNTRVITLTGSGTAGMEASVMNLFTENDKLLVINGGSFGQRFCEICSIHRLEFTSVNVDFGKTLKKEELEKYNGKGYTAVLVNLHETSSGTLYDIDVIGDFAKRNGCFLLVDAISCFLGEKIDMQANNIDAVIIGSQKALALAPGLCLIALNEKAIERIRKNVIASLYFDFKNYLLDGERGQTPFTPAVGIITALNKRLNMIDANGGTDAEIANVKTLAEYFRRNIKALPFEMFSEAPSYCCTSLRTAKGNATEIFNMLKDEYGIFVCPNGGKYKDDVFRVGHIGCLTTFDYDVLISAFNELAKRGII